MKKETITRPQNQAPSAAADKKAPTRRDFVKTTAAAGAGLLIVPSAIAFGSAVNSSLGLGIIGCGGRGHNSRRRFLHNTTTGSDAPVDTWQIRQEGRRERLRENFRFKPLQGAQGL